MKVFYIFMVVCFVASLFAGRTKPAWRFLGMLALCAFMVFAYFFWHKI